MRIAVDALGGDNAPEEVVSGVLRAARRLASGTIVLVGPPERLEPYLGGDDRPPNLDLVASGGVISMSEEPAAALRANPEASVAVAATLVRRGEADALFSAGSTGATVAAALLGIGRLKGCRRPAIATVLPFPRPVLLLDAGATIVCRPQDLLNFAILGSVFAKRYFGLEGEARVGLINVGEEPGKGSDLARESHGLLSSSPAVNFVGNVEGRDIGSGTADVLVTDGFTGNVVLKTAEGTAREILSMVRSAVTEGGPQHKLAGAVLRPRLVAVRDQVDPENYGGSFLLGVRGSVVIGHGNSRARGVENALAGISGAGAGLTGELQDALLAGNAS
ncbi:plsX: fatty acid/phospholipid synthesis protein PlsX [Rubrobacter radiotolerans]|uniref:Phosphate acyltransferase n=1 Tax=Rubrobacter radiotolerans TaxID=42256 RepID=A0A023X3B1_RUBRA|nr:phosphate acyltransferase PlsX [Rubrobacter radiotolerans]AHY46666.1 plsX: fatty acid/phospholipid synthesis protein PlsX [Rubrobacter radiotolerans]MDX5894073.1 phosphate acyltransferase PlsX [Rubrobacter radiotolerans]SMC05120.1 phosphate:acyl-[acyl carrier protein] acyltransferase [Rubrobacter radiotolerans DSM 5868]